MVYAFALFCVHFNTNIMSILFPSAAPLPLFPNVHVFSLKPAPFFCWVIDIKAGGAIAQGSSSPSVPVLVGVYFSTLRRFW